MEWFAGLAPVTQALIGTLFTWGMTALGAALVFTTKNVNQKFLDSMLGFAAGVMIAASYWSLLAPAIEMSQGKSVPAWVPAGVGFLLGGLFLSSIDKILRIYIQISHWKVQKVFILGTRNEVHCSFSRLRCIIYQKV